jgi:hypothetical protein
VSAAADRSDGTECLLFDESDYLNRGFAKKSSSDPQLKSGNLCYSNCVRKRCRALASALVRQAGRGSMACDAKQTSDFCKQWFRKRFPPGAMRFAIRGIREKR